MSLHGVGWGDKVSNDHHQMSLVGGFTREGVGWISQSGVPYIPHDACDVPTPLPAKQNDRYAETLPSRNFIGER